MSLTRLELKEFTAFRNLRVDFSPGINVFIGENGTGKTHLLKVLYSACEISNSGKTFAEKLTNVFLPSKSQIGRLVWRQRGKLNSNIRVFTDKINLSLAFHSHMKNAGEARVVGLKSWMSEENKLNCVYIPVKEMLANAPGFRAALALRLLHFEEIYADIIDRAFLPLLRGPADQNRRRLLKILRNAMQGTVDNKDEEFILRTAGGHFEFTLLAEGIRKLGLLYLLIQNGTLSPGSVLFWDEPESNLNPGMMGPLMNILLTLQRNGVQVFLATHSYNVLKELDLHKKKGDQLLYHPLYRHAETNEIRSSSTPKFLDIEPNAILQAFNDLYDREITRTLGGSK